ncbi:MAG TPA: hypothetical protein VF297_01925 [Pyrinomonadaceae bacterium]
MSANLSSITSWARLEPRARGNALGESLQARVHDPLWMLARQWQVGEFLGEDAGSPVSSTLSATSARLTAYYPGRVAGGAAAQGLGYDPSALPLETLVEREDVLPGQEVSGRNLRAAAEAGLYFLRRLPSFNPSGKPSYRETYLRQYPLAAPDDAARARLDAGTLSFLELMAGRAPDGALLYASLKPSVAAGTLPPTPLIEAADKASVLNAAKAFVGWYESLFSVAPSGRAAWRDESMEYAFAVAAKGADNKEVVLSAPEHGGGALDWYSFVQVPQATLGASVVAKGSSIKVTRQPLAVGFPGAPARRWWEFEDGRVDFGAVRAAPEDLGRMLLGEFMMSYGNDWFLLPLDLEVGSVCRITALEVFDTFGSKTVVKPYTEVDGSGGSWFFFSLSRDPRATGEVSADLLFLPPTLGRASESRPVEEVLFLRDEMANMAWAVERTVESPGGVPLDRFADARERRARDTASRPASDALPAYRLAGTVPENWIPLLPRPPGAAGGNMRLARGAMTGAGGEIVPPLGRILAPERALEINEEEVPREGARVTRGYQFTRWLNGASLLWVGRRKQPGRGEGSSGLRFDTVEHP